ncbi:type II secretion system F family protein [Patescibacteria group bacterium]|nr:type II secretion system F family protein [Patescibacteria group bacterium]
MRFNYQARTKTGSPQAGTVEASSREAAVALLEKYGLYVTSLERTTAVPVFFRKIKLFQRISSGEIVGFSRQLAIMFRSRIPIVEIFYTLAKQTKNPLFKEKIVQIAEDVEGGVSLSSTLTKHPKIFSQFYVSMVKSGEVSGELAEVLDYLADHLEREKDFHSKMTGAMIYPAMVLIVVLVVILAMTLFVIPQLGEMIREMEMEIPLMTELVLGFSDLLKKWGIFFLIGVVILIFPFFRFLKTKEGKKAFAKFSLKIPILGGFLKKVYLTRFAENLSTLISGGLPIARALEITADIVGNDVYRTIILRTRDGVRRGETISSILEGYPEVIPPLFTQMTLVGEKAGRVSPALMSIVGFYKKDVDRTLDNFVSFLEPLLIIFLGVVVAGLMISVLMPIYQVALGGF